MSDKKYSVLFVDDDNYLVESHEGLLLDLCFAANLELYTYTDFGTVLSQLSEYKAAERGLPVLAIIDLWLVDKRSNESDEQGGLKVLHLLQKRFPDIFFVIYSAHITDAANDPYRVALQGVKSHIVIKKKPQNARLLLSNVRQLLLKMEFKFSVIQP